MATCSNDRGWKLGMAPGRLSQYGSVLGASCSSFVSSFTTGCDATLPEASDCLQPRRAQGIWRGEHVSQRWLRRFDLLAVLLDDAIHELRCLFGPDVLIEEHHDRRLEVIDSAANAVRGKPIEMRSAQGVGIDGARVDLSYPLVARRFEYRRCRGDADLGADGIRNV